MIIGLLDGAQDHITYNVSLAIASGIRARVYEMNSSVGDVRQIVFEGAAPDAVYEEVCLCLK